MESFIEKYVDIIEKEIYELKKELNYSIVRKEIEELESKIKIKEEVINLLKFKQI